MFYRVKDVKALADMRLLAIFTDGTRKVYDVKPLLSRWEAFGALREIPGLFAQVRVDTGGYGISWNDEIDLSADELWVNGVRAQDAG